MAERKMPVWAESTTPLSNGDVNKEDPGSAKQVLGFIIEKPLVQTMNWLLNLVGHFVKANNEIKVVPTGYEAEVGETVLLDNGTGSALGYLPAAPVDRQKVSFGGVALHSVNSLTVNGNGKSIMEVGVTDLTLDIDARMFEFTFDQSTSIWELSLGNLRGNVQ